MEPKYSSKKFLELQESNAKIWITLFTPAYQRANTITRLYNSLLNLKVPKDRVGNPVIFVWFIVNDGSTDATDEMLKLWCEDNKLPICYYYQQNQGKHVAVNFAVNHCSSEMFLTIDSDDTLMDCALEVFYSEWMKIANKELYKGLTARSIDPDTRTILGSKLPTSPFDVTTADMRLKYHIRGEMCGFNRVDLMREYPFPTPDPRMRFCPENIVWYEMGKKYKERVVDIAVREYYKDTSNAITSKSTNRAISNYYWWKYGVNNLLKYIIYSPKEILKFVVGMSMDGFRTNRSVMNILNDAHTLYGKILLLLFMPIGFILSRK